MLLPVLLIVAGLFGGGLAAVFAQSLGLGVPDPDGLLGPVPTLRHYAELASNREFYLSLGLTLWIAALTTTLSVAGGVGLALLLHAIGRARRLLYALLQVPLGVPHVVIALAVVTLFGQSGIPARAAYHFGLISAPAGFPELVYDAYGIGIVIAYVIKEVPFVAVVATALLVRLGSDYDAVARTLGASRWQRIRHVTLPLIAPGVGGAALMVFAYVFAAFETPFVLGRPYPAMLSVVVEREFSSLELMDRPRAMAMAMVMTLLAAAAVRGYLVLWHASISRDRPVLF
jgi:putative spermidine/putrescine transport system permease protein